MSEGEPSMAQLDTDPDVVVIPSEGVDVYRGPEAVRAFLDRTPARVRGRQPNDTNEPNDKSEPKRHKGLRHD